MVRRRQVEKVKNKKERELKRKPHNNQKNHTKIYQREWVGLGAGMIDSLNWGKGVVDENLKKY